MKKYEAVFILDVRKVDDEGKAFAGEFEALIREWGGTVCETEFMGRKQFAREIKKRKVGVYVDFVFELDPAKEAQIREHFRLDERILRLLIVLFERPTEVRSSLATSEAAAE